MNKKLVIASVLGTGVLAVGALVPIAVFAQTATDSTSVSTFVQKLADKLGIDQNTVQTALDSVKTDMQAERVAQFKTDVSQAVTDGKLTQRQADILLGVEDVMPTLAKPIPDTSVDLSTLTEDQRKAQMDTMRTQMDQSIVDALNAKGLATTVSELQSAQDAARTAGLRAGFGGHVRGPGGEFGFGFGGGPANSSSTSTAPVSSAL